MLPWSRAFALRQRLKESLWALPLVGCVAGSAAGQVALALDSRVHLPSGWQYSAGQRAACSRRSSAR